MKNNLFALFLFINYNLYPQKIFSTDHSYQSDIKIYVVDYEYQADLKVFKVKYKNNQLIYQKNSLSF